MSTAGLASWKYKDIMGHICSKDTVTPLRTSSAVALQQITDPTSLDGKHPKRSSRQMLHHPRTSQTSPRTQKWQESRKWGDEMEGAHPLKPCIGPTILPTQLENPASLSHCPWRNDHSQPHPGTNANHKHHH
ncbi:hypothetical protein UPYG_G00244160 [Umbra pygmaea]|uniref:Uncharacterized protein n=1 Tax=Umbra pygmaea TaxID=75934 RepID=A0ABD0WLC3_UMBPY